MDYRLTPIATDAPIPAQAAADPLSQQVHRSVFMGKLEDVLHKAVAWGRKNSIWPFNFGLSCCYVEMATSLHQPLRHRPLRRRGDPRHAARGRPDGHRRHGASSRWRR